MDAKQLGAFIALRRKELNLTQAGLAERLHVTDKAVSRWERGIGLPDVQTLEPLAQALEISLVELLQMRRDPSDHIPTADAEQLLSDTLRMSAESSTPRMVLGALILGGFALISVLLLSLSGGDPIGLSTTGAIAAGLISWAFPIWQLTLARKNYVAVCAVCSLSFGLASVLLANSYVVQKAAIGDWSAIADTAQGLLAVAATYSAITIGLNILTAAYISSKKERIG